MRRIGTWLRWTVLLLAGALLSACYLEWDDGHLYWEPSWNDAPQVLDAEAGCYWDGYERDYLWYFEAVVDDWDGVWDVDTVWAEVYESGPYDRYVDSLRLTRTGDPHLWVADRWERDTDLWCGEGYTVDFVAEDWWGDTDVLSVRAHEDDYPGGSVSW